VVSRQYLCTVWGIAQACGIHKRQSGQGCNRFGSLCGVQSSSFILPGLCILLTLPEALTPHWYVLSCRTQKCCLAGWQHRVHDISDTGKRRKEHRLYNILRLFILRNNIYSSNTEQSFIMFSLVVYVQHTACVTTCFQSSSFACIFCC